MGKLPFMKQRVKDGVTGEQRCNKKKKKLDGRHKSQGRLGALKAAAYSANISLQPTVFIALHITL